MNAYVQVFDLARPMTWRTFNRLPVTKQIEYIRFLKEDMNANNRMIGQMFGVHGHTIEYRTRLLGLDYGEGSRLVSKAQRRRWNEWLLQGEDPEMVRLLGVLRRATAKPLETGEERVDWA